MLRSTLNCFTFCSSVRNIQKYSNAPLLKKSIKYFYGQLPRVILMQRNARVKFVIGIEGRQRDMADTVGLRMQKGAIKNNLSEKLNYLVSTSGEEVTLTKSKILPAIGRTSVSTPWYIIIHKSGPRTDPCGTPHVINFFSSSDSQHKSLLIRKWAPIHTKCSGLLKLIINSSILLHLKELKAFFKSSVITAHYLSSSSAVLAVLVARTSAFVIDLPFRKPNWFSERPPSFSTFRSYLL